MSGSVASTLPAKNSKPRAERPSVPATFYAVAGANDTYYRVRMPAKAVGANTCLIPVETGKQQLDRPGLRREFRWLETEDGALYPDHEGAAIFTRPDQARAVHALEMRRQGVRVIAEVDDNYFAPYNQNYFLRALWDEEARKRHRGAMQAFDAVIVTTPYLRDVYRKQLREVGARPEFFVCDNQVDPDDWPERVTPRADGRLRVGWMGGDSHSKDVRLAFPALQWAARAGHEVVIIGYDPHWRPEQMDESRWKGEGFEYTHIPWKDPRVFDRKDARWPLDIAVAPLRRDQFGMGKSDVKVLEYGLVGAAVVASAGVVYDDAVRHGETGLLATSQSSFLYEVQRLCVDDSLRERVAANLQEYIRAERLIGQHRGDWEAAIAG